MTARSRKDTTGETEIRRLIEDRAMAARSKNIHALMSNHSPDLLAFDVVNPLQYAGSDAVKTRAQEWFSLYEGPIGYTIRDLRVVAGDDVAFAYYLYRVEGTRRDGAQVDMWVRATVCYRRGADEMWMVAHEHQSVPFDPTTGKASLDLKP